ncbi:MAG: hypothetical protein DRQ88_07360 [Epsilonproteobacteria bacterium]|nr:MAG: hypothetical protein DRQ88_07360 [Campylobacterota bacterium]
MKLSYVLLTFSLLTLSSFASEIKVTPLKKVKVKKSKINYRFSFSSSFNTDFKQYDDINKSFTNSSGLRFSLSLPKSWTIATGLFFDKSFIGERKGEIRDTFIAVTKPLVQFNKSLGLTAKLNLYLPISEFSREVIYLSTAYRLALILGFDLAGIGIPSIGGYARMDILQNFHRSHTNAYGSSNNQFKILGLGGVDWNFLKKLNLALDFSYTKALTYEGNIRDYYGSNQTLSYSITNKFSVGIGHALGGNILAVNGRDSNVALFDSNQSVAFMVFNFIL